MAFQFLVAQWVILDRPGTVQAETVPPGAEGKADSADQLAQGRAVLERALKGIEAMSAKIPAESFDIKTVAGKLGGDAEAVVKWVRDNTRLVVYRGVLRGPVGVLMDRLGNSLDRALLRAALQVECSYRRS